MDNYNKWLEKEQEWIDQMAKETKSSAIKVGLLCIPACAVIFGLIGILSGGGISAMFLNALWGAVFGVVIAPFMLFLMPRPRKFYAKALEQYAKTLNSEEREMLGSQMLSPDVRCIDYKSVTKVKAKVMITQSFLISNTAQGFFALVKLDQVDQILTDVRDMSFTTRSHGVSIHSYDEEYSIEFRYKKPAGVVSKDADITLVFPTTEIRSEVMRYIKEFVSQRPDPPTIVGTQI